MIAALYIALAVIVIATLFYAIGWRPQPSVDQDMPRVIDPATLWPPGFTPPPTWPLPEVILPPENARDRVDVPGGNKKP